MYRRFVSVGWQALSLSPGWRKEKIILVHANDAVRLRREGGFEELPRMGAWAQLDGLRDMGAIRDFAFRIRLAGTPLSLLKDDAVLAMLRGAIQKGELVVLRADGGGVKATESTTAEQRQLVAKIEARTRARLSYLGRVYKLSADSDLARIPQRDSYEVVPHEDATRILDGLATQADPDLARLLAEARQKLAADWRPPFAPDGLILLRRVITLAAAKPDAEAPITPSQMRAMLRPEQNATFEVIVLGIDDKPINDVEFTIEAPDDEDYKGSLGASGKTSIKSSKTGPAGVTLFLKKVEARP